MPYVCLNMSLMEIKSGPGDYLTRDRNKSSFKVSYGLFYISSGVVFFTQISRDVLFSYNISQ